MMDLFSRNPVRRPALGRARLVIGSLALAAAIAFSGPLAAPAFAQQDSEGVVARVDGEAITEADLATAMDDFGSSLANYPPNQRRAILIDVLVNLKVMANAAQKAGMADTDEFTRRMQFLRDRALRDAYFDAEVGSKVTEEDLRQAYEENVASDKQQEVRARHILVNTEEEAKAVIEELDGGADFAELAKQKSTGPSSADGGDLGFFGEGDMVPQFWEAASALKAGEVSGPVQTEFGWHVIKVEEIRDREPPPFEALTDQIREFLVRQRFTQVIEGLKKDAVIEITEGAGATEPSPSE